MQAVSKNIELKSGLIMPCLGYGTWRLGENPDREKEEIAAIRRAYDLGIRHFDTAEMYGEGATEALLGRAFSGAERARLFITSKFYPHNASPAKMARACERSLSALKTDYLDLYLLHWPGATPFEETLEGALKLREAGKIRAFGISNFDVRGLLEIVEDGLHHEIDVNQVMYNPGRRGVEFDLLPLMRTHGIACVAYTPVEPRLIAGNAAFARLAGEMGLSPAALALSWHMTRGAALPIPKAASVAHVEELVKAADISLGKAELDAIDRIFPPPSRAMPLDIV